MQSPGDQPQLAAGPLGIIDALTIPIPVEGCDDC